MTESQSTDTSVQLPAKHGVSPGGLRPVTIRQLLDATRQHSDAPFQIDDFEVHRISLVAHVVCVRAPESLIIYDLEDGTSRGRISARQWTSDANCDQLPDDCSKLYVHLTGHLDRKVELNSRNWVIVEHIHVVTDMPDRLFCHILETAFVTLSFQHGPPPTTALKSVEPRDATIPSTTPIRCDALTILSPSRVAGSSSQPQPALPAQIGSPEPPTSSSTSQQHVPRTSARGVVLATPIRHPAPTRQPLPARSPSSSPPPSSPSPGPSSPPAPPTPPPPERSSKTAGKRRQPGIKRDPFADLTVLQRAILLQLMSAPPSEHGTDVTAVAMGVSHHEVTSSEVGGALDELVELGHIGSTIDDSHYAVKTSHYPRSP